MDEDAAQLVRHLSTRAGMLMEDVSARAILIGRLDAQELAAVAREIERTGNDIMALARTMHVLT